MTDISTDLNASIFGMKQSSATAFSEDVNITTSRNVGNWRHIPQDLEISAAPL
jgi:alkylhydroperoxidase family enzyme